MRPQRRQAVLAAILPGLAVGAAYLFLFAKPAKREIDSLRATMRRAGETKSPPGAEAEQAARMRRLYSELDRLKEARDREAAVPGGTATAGGGAPDRAKAGERLTRLLARHDLRLTEETAEAGAAAGALPPESRKPPVGTPSDARPRSLRFRGRFLDVLAALREMDGLRDSALPIRIRMEPAADGKEALQWTLIVRL